MTKSRLWSLDFMKRYFKCGQWATKVQCSLANGVLGWCICEPLFPHPDRWMLKISCNGPFLYFMHFFQTETKTEEAMIFGTPWKNTCQLSIEQSCLYGNVASRNQPFFPHFANYVFGFTILQFLPSPEIFLQQTMVIGCQCMVNGSNIPYRILFFGKNPTFNRSLKHSHLKESYIGLTSEATWLWCT